MKWMSLWSRFGLASLCGAVVLLVVQSLAWLQGGQVLNLELLRPITRLVTAVNLRDARLPTPWPGLNEIILTFGVLWLGIGGMLLVWQLLWLMMRKQAARSVGAAPPMLPPAKQDAMLRAIGRTVLGVVMLGVALGEVMHGTRGMRQPQQLADLWVPEMIPVALCGLQIGAAMFLMAGQKLRSAAWVCLLATLPQLAAHPIRGSSASRLEPALALFIAQLGMVAALLLLLGSLPRPAPPAAAKPAGAPAPKPAAPAGAH
jgi:hypothetical protein